MAGVDEGAEEEWIMGVEKGKDRGEGEAGWGFPPGECHVRVILRIWPQGVTSFSSLRRCIPKQSRGTGLLALTGDEEYHLDCKRKAIQAGLYLDEWGVWEWEPDSQSISRFQTSSAPHKKSSLGALWGSETEADEGRWVQLETPDEEQVLNAIGGEYVPPEKRNFRFIVGKKKVKKDPVAVENP